MYEPPGQLQLVLSTGEAFVLRFSSLPVATLVARKKSHYVVGSPGDAIPALLEYAFCLNPWGLVDYLILAIWVGN